MWLRPSCPFVRLVVSPLRLCAGNLCSSASICGCDIFRLVAATRRKPHGAGTLRVAPPLWLWARPIASGPLDTSNGPPARAFGTNGGANVRMLARLLRIRARNVRITAQRDGMLLQRGGIFPQRDQIARAFERIFGPSRPIFPSRERRAQAYAPIVRAGMYGGARWGAAPDDSPAGMHTVAKVIQST